MNYLAEIRHFYDWLETESLPSNAIVLWHALMFTANRCGWREEFSVPFSVLENRTKLDKSTICRMRRILLERGVISVRGQRGRRSAVYRLNPFERHPAEHDTTVSATQIHRMTGKALQSATPTATVSIQDRIIPEKEKTSKKEKAPRRREERKGCAEKREPIRQNLSQFLASLDEAWRAPMSIWLEYKRSRREGYRSEMGARKCLALLRDLSGDDPAVADIRSGLKEKLFVALSDSTAILHPDKYLQSGDSVKVYDSPNSKESKASVGMYEIVYELKRSENGERILISRNPDLTADDISSQVAGWISRCMLQPIGERLFAETPWSRAGSQLPNQAYAPVIKPVRVPAGSSFSSGLLYPLIDPSGNRVYNIDGEPISFARGQQIKKDLQQINVLIVIEPSASAARQYPMLLNVIQNLQPVFASDSGSFTYRFGAAIGVPGKIEIQPLQTDFAHTVGLLTRLDPQIKTAASAGFKPWNVLRKGLALFETFPSSTNLILLFGEQGEQQETAPDDIVQRLQQFNCRILGLQFEAQDKNPYHNFVLQLTDMIAQYATHRSIQKRRIIVSSDQYRRENRFREIATNCYMLDFPTSAITQGGVLFPTIGQTFHLEKFPAAVDSLIRQIRDDNRLLSENLDQAFASVGNDKDRFYVRVTETFGWQHDMKPDKSYQRLFQGKIPLWYCPVPRRVVPDSLLRYRLLLSGTEREQFETHLNTLCAVPVDVKDNNQPSKGRRRALCRYLAETDPDTIDSLSAPTSDTKVHAELDTVYVCTRKTRRHLRQFYLSELKTCRICHPSNRSLKRLTLDQAHQEIFGVPANDSLLKRITIKALHSRSLCPDRELDALIDCFEASKARFSEKSQNESFMSGSTEYICLDPQLLP